MKTIKSSIAILMAVTILSCNNRTTSSEDKVATQEVDLKSIKPEEQTASADTSAAIATMPLQGSQPSSTVDWDKKIIKTANVTLELKDYNAYNQTIHSSLKKYGAYIASEQQNQSEGKIQDVVSIKVPVDMFEDLMNTLPAEGAKVLEKHISTEDVTGEVIDTKARTEAKKQVRDRYLSMLKQAKNIKEIFEVQKEINAMQEDIEAGNGRAEYLVHQSAYSTINLTYFQYLDGSTQTDNPPSFFARLKDAFKEGSSIFTGLLVVLVSFWPLLIAGAVIWFYLKKVRVVKRGSAV